jgi:ABC-type uncharacterized transport system permease subunit
MKRFIPDTINVHDAEKVKPVAAFFSYKTFFSTALLNTKIIITAAVLLYSLNSCAQQSITADSSYQKVIAERSAKIVQTLNITDAAKFKKVQDIIANQHFQLNAVHEGSKAIITSVKAQQLSKEEINEAVKNESEKKYEQLKQLHTPFIALLKNDLTAQQVEQVKDGMTYRILPVTWTAYMDMLQQLTPEQKEKMYNWLVEARELAIDEGSSDAKHAVFGKYKGKINNYLSAAGYDMKKEGEDWAKRIKAAKENKQTQTNL